MKMTINRSGAALEIALEGRLDQVSAPELEEELHKSLNGVDSLTLDFSHLDYISSAGLRVLLFAQQTLAGGKGVKILHPNELVKEVFNVTGLSNILTVE